MLKRHIIVILLCLSYGFAQSAPIQELRIKGHAIGETGAAFLRIEPQAQQWITECHSDPNGDKAYISQESYRRICESHIKALENNGDGTIQLSGEAVWDSSQWQFEGGRLAKVELSFCCGYQRIRDDLSKRIGSKPTEKTRAYQNGFGARWAGRIATWTTPRYHAVLREDNDPSRDDNDAVAVIETSKSYKARQMREKNQPSPLD